MVEGHTYVKDPIMFDFSHRMFNPQPEPPAKPGYTTFDPQPPPDPRSVGLLLPAVQA